MIAQHDGIAFEVEQNVLCLQSKSAWMTVSFVREFVHAKIVCLCLCVPISIFFVYTYVQVFDFQVLRFLLLLAGKKVKRGFKDGSTVFVLLSVCFQVEQGDEYFLRFHRHRRCCFLSSTLSP